MARHDCRRRSENRIGSGFGALCGWLLRWHSLFGMAIFLALKLAAGLWPEMIPAPVTTLGLSAAVLGFAVERTLRSGTLRWPSNAPIVAAFAGLACFIAASACTAMQPDSSAA